ncbi:hypothetical protein [Bradyrhizobium sp. LB11.1]|uniref:hypothetical protein n=1 Tax=Bradyrhizobium sp. LB11.1 TaxID=3156326 RepID=UPI003390F5B8
MALAGSWQVAAALVLAERIGRALRKPTVEVMLSCTTGELGKGWVYARNTALDEIGATIGPLIIALVLLLKGDFRTGYAFLTISAAAALVSLVVARVNFPLPSRLERGRTAPAGDFGSAYWLYMLVWYHTHPHHDTGRQVYLRWRASCIKASRGSDLVLNSL